VNPLPAVHLGAAAYVLGSLATIVAVVALGAASHRVRRALLPDWDGRAAVLAEIVTGTSINAAAKAHGLPVSTVRSWTRAPETVAIVQQQKKDLGVLLAEYLVTGIATLTAQLREAGRPEYIAQQPADHLAILHGVIADKLVRILAGIEIDHN